MTSTITRQPCSERGKISDVKPKIVAAWEMHAARRAVFFGELVCVRVEPGVALRSDVLRSMLASQLLVELVAILDDGLAIVLRGTSKKKRGYTLKKRIDLAADAGLVADPEPLHAVRRRRDAILHDYATMPWQELHAHELVVAQHLRSWGLVNGEPEFTAATEVAPWERVDDRWRRSIWVGVRDAAGARAWGYQLAELRKQDAEHPREATAAGTQESALEWYAATTLAALDPDED